jgi:hypothetical protein
MPQVLTMTQNPGESNEEFASRISEQVTSFFGQSTGETSPGSPDVSSKEAEPTEDETTASLNRLFEEFGRGPGWVTNPEGTRKLHAYWVRGEGAGKIRWGQEGDFARCERLVGEKIAKNDPGKLRFIKQICAQWHKDATGATPGNAPGEGD